MKIVLIATLRMKWGPEKSTIFNAVGSLESFKTPSKLTSWFPANVAADGPPVNKNE